MSYIEAENNMVKIQDKLTEKNLLIAEADTFNCLSVFLN